jgi:predicted RNase H-like nuclease
MAVLGIDWCRAGWAGVVLDGAGWVAGVFAVELASLAVQAAAVAEIAVIAVDMPIGLPDGGQRQADLLAREAVGPRWRSVFMTPVRAAMAEDTYQAAAQVSRRLTGGGISQQAYALRPRIIEVDAWTAASTVPVIEVHPEVSFATLAGAVLPHPKKCWAGMVLRRNLLAGAANHRAGRTRPARRPRRRR